MSTVSKIVDKTPRGRGASDASGETALGVRVSLRIEAWPAVDLAMSVAPVVHRPAQRALEAGRRWRARAEAAGFVPAIEPYGKEIWINILGLCLDDESARTPAGFLDALDRIAPEEVLRYLTGFYRRVFRRETPADVMDAAIAGDKAARLEFRRTSFPDVPELRTTLRHLLSAPATEIADEFRGLLRRWHDEVFAQEAEALGSAATADARALRQWSEGRSAEAIVEHACPGITYVPEAGQTDVVLAPSLVLRPSYAILDHRSANLFTYPATIGARSAGPPERLVTMARAIGDTTRLRILRLLAEEPLGPGELAERLGMPRTTLLHHLAQLREANLIGLQVHDSAYHTYVVRDEHLGDLGRLLADYLRTEDR
jgi:DNA-binding transcriptional ArsR family regulator